METQAFAALGEAACPEIRHSSIESACCSVEISWNRDFYDILLFEQIGTSEQKHILLAFPNQL